MNSIENSVWILVSMLYKRDDEYVVVYNDLVQGPFRLFLGIVGKRSGVFMETYLSTFHQNKPSLFPKALKKQKPSMFMMLVSLFFLKNIKNVEKMF